MRFLTAFALTICFASAAFGQEDRDRKMLEQAAARGTQLETQITVTRNVTAQAVLIPKQDARRIFGKEIAENYAVIELNIGNKSSDAALIIHGIFIDYSDWALRGGGPSLARGPRQNGALSAAEHAARQTSEPFQASTIASQVASEEYRIVRGQLQNAQMYSTRNWTMRLLTFAGSLASATTFPFNERGVLKSFNVFSGVFVPGLREAWPDATVEQINRVSDFGYQANKVIPRQGAEVVVCFFPIDRFLTPGFKRLFKKSPALFFAPLQMLMDKEIRKDVEKAFGEDLGIPGLQINNLNKALPCYLSISENLFDADTCIEEYGLEMVMERHAAGDTDVPRLKFKQNATPKQRENADLFRALNFIDQVSLNRVRVTVDGVMTVDTTNVAAKIDDVRFDSVLNCGDDKAPCFWASAAANGGVRTGTLPGSYLTGGSVSIAEAGDLGITEVKTLADNSNDQTLRFSFKLTKPVPPDTPLHFVVSKVQPGAAGTSVRTVNSLPREYRVGYTPVAPKVKLVTQDGTQDGAKLTVTGSDFLDAPPTYPLVVKLVSPGGEEVEVKPTISGDGKTLTIALPDEVKDPGCWKVKVGVGPGGVVAAAEDPDCACFVILPKPTISEAVISGNAIRVKGADLFDTSDCPPVGRPLRFQLTKEGAPAGEKPRNVRSRLSPDGEEAVLELPAAAKKDKWNVHVLLGSEEKGKVELKPEEQ